MSAGDPSRSLPAYDELPVLEPLGLRHAWGVFGPDDQLGTINLLTPERVLDAARLVRTGRTVTLTRPLDAFDPPFYGRERMRHTVFRLDRNYWTTASTTSSSRHPQPGRAAPRPGPRVRVLGRADGRSRAYVRRRTARRGALGAPRHRGARRAARPGPAPGGGSRGVRPLREPLDRPRPPGPGRPAAAGGAAGRRHPAV